MLRAIDSAVAGDWPAREALDAVALDYDARRRRRFALACVSGRRLLLDLPRAPTLREGDGLRLAEGGWVRVEAAPEPLIDIRCASEAELVRIAWHLGNRHLPTEITPAALYIRPDHVIEKMLIERGADLTAVERPFNPEGGAYHQHSGHAHAHSHAHESDAPSEANGARVGGDG